MVIGTAARRTSFVFLCCVPFLNFITAGDRALRIPGLYQVAGLAFFAAVVVAAWVLGGQALRSGAGAARRLALAGALLLGPWAMVSLFWVGLSTPWEATPGENLMRYQVLLVGAMVVTIGFTLLAEALRAAGGNDEAMSVGVAASSLAGAGYLVWVAYEIGIWVARAHAENAALASAPVDDPLEFLLDAACGLTYLATAAFAVALGRAALLGRGGTRAYVILNALPVLFLVLKELKSAVPSSHTAPWYAQPGFVVGIPAVPWIMPFLLGVVVLRRAGFLRSAASA